jgi:UDP-2-acetamido-2,6-beta-L-arabino-hexul-4-ose reductase
MTKIRVVVTGAGGFIGRNLIVRLSELGAFEAVPIDAEATPQSLMLAIAAADVVVHLAGVNRPENISEFMAGNRDSVVDLIAAIEATGRAIPVILTSSVHAEIENPYGQSKKAAETALREFGDRTSNPVHIFRLPNVFGKWCRPNYNSAVATFCYNTARGLPITINDPTAPLSLVYIDDVLAAIIAVMENGGAGGSFQTVEPLYKTTVGYVADLIARFHSDRSEGLIEAVGQGLVRALYATYVAALPIDDFTYPLIAHTDTRGTFTEMLKTRTSGQFSYFTAHPGVIRGGHYHHTKTEKFLVLSGEARFGFRNMLTGETHEVFTHGGEPVVVETIPGWTHDITNIGGDLLITLLWANEIFDRSKPDTIAENV